MPKKSTFTGITSVPGTYFFDVFGQGFNYRISKSNLFQQMTDEIGASGVQSIDGLSGALQLIAGTNMSIAVNSVDGSFTFNSSLTPENIQSLSFDTAAGVAVTEGQIAWNAVDDTVDIGVPGGAIQVGKEVFTTVRNSTGTTLVDGEAVYITGSTGINTTVARAQANSPTADLTIGIVTQTIPNGQDGRVTLIGKVRNFDTSMWSEGDELWLSATVSGGITNVKPAAPNHAVHVGFVIRSSATVGVIFVRILATESISELHDVVLTSTQDRNLIILDAASQTWQNGYLDYGDFAGAQPIVLQNNIRAFGRNAADTASIDVWRVSDSDIVILGDTDNITTIQSSIVPRAFYGGMQYDMITTEGGQTVGGTDFGVGGVLYTWPASSAAGVLTNDGAGNLSWTDGITGQLFCVSGAIDGTPGVGVRLSFGAGESTSNNGIVVPRDCKFVMATLMATGLDGTLTLALEIDQVAQSAAHDLSATGTVTNETDIVDVASTPLAVSSGQQVNYEVTTAPTAAGAIDVVLWFVFD